MSLSLNDLAAIKNPYQGDVRKVLCLCSMGLLRSPTMANVLHKELGLNTRSAGVNADALIKVDERLVEWADFIVCAEQYHANRVTSMFKITKPIYVLAIPDQFPWNDSELKEKIREAFKEQGPV